METVKNIPNESQEEAQRDEVKKLADFFSLLMQIDKRIKRKGAEENDK